MNISPCSLVGSFLITPDKKADERGFFARTICRDTFSASGLVSDFVQSNLSHNHHAGTLRGMHLQRPPHGEIKLVRCVNGAIFDAIVDLRVGSPTYKKWVGFELSAENARSLYVPTGFAHGYVTLTDNADVLYNVSHPYHPSAELGLRYDEPEVGIDWPVAITSVSAKDDAWPSLADSEQHFARFDAGSASR